MCSCFNTRNQWFAKLDFYSLSCHVLLFYNLFMMMSSYWCWMIIINEESSLLKSIQPPEAFPLQYVNKRLWYRSVVEYSTLIGRTVLPAIRWTPGLWNKVYIRSSWMKLQRLWFIYSFIRLFIYLFTVSRTLWGPVWLSSFYSFAFKHVSSMP